MISCYGCEPSKMNTPEPQVDTSAQQDPDPEPLEPIGVIPADDCRQLNIGDTACNFALVDQNGDVWELYQHRGEIVVLDLSAAWCYPCQLAGDHAQPLQDEYGADGVTIVTVLIDGATMQQPPTQFEISQWVNSHNVTTAPVLEGSREKMIATTPDALDGYLLSGFPTYVYIGRDMKFYAAHVGFSEEAARFYIEEGL